MAVLTVQNISVDGTSATYAAADAGGDEAPVGPGTFVHVKNDSGAAVTVTFDVPVTVGGAASVAPSVPAGGELLMPIPRRRFRGHEARSIDRTTSERAMWTYSAVTSVTVAALKAP